MQKLYEIPIEITEEDIENGIQRNLINCPVARALKRFFTNLYPNDRIGVITKLVNSTITIFQGESYTPQYVYIVKHNNLIRDFIVSYDELFEQSQAAPFSTVLTEIDIKDYSGVKEKQ